MRAKILVALFLAGCTRAPIPAKAQSLEWAYDSGSDVLTVEGLDYEPAVFRRAVQLPNGDRLLALFARIGDRKVRTAQLLEADGPVTVITGAEPPLSVSYNAGLDRLIIDGGRWPAEFFRDFANQDRDLMIVAVVRNGVNATIYTLGGW